MDLLSQLVSLPASFSLFPRLAPLPTALAWSQHSQPSAKAPSSLHSQSQTSLHHQPKGPSLPTGAGDRALAHI